MEQYAILKKVNFDDFIMQLARIKKVVAPVKRGVKNFVFEEVKTSKEIALKYVPTILPPKKYFFPQKETLVEYNKTEKIWDTTLYCEGLVLFGVHTCDLAGIQCLNIVFSDEPKDYNYLMRKNKITIIGFECNDYCDEYASCAVMDNHNPNGGYDLFFTEIDDYFIIHVNTLMGEELLEKLGMFKNATEKNMAALEKLRKKKRTIFKDEVDVDHNDLKPLFDESLESKVWDDLGSRCLACGNCTNVCPTCYCYDVEDDLNLDLNTGVRERKWDSCQNTSFATVAGGENFREKRSDRQRHRYMRKFKYPLSKYRRYFCTGCGRCSRTCMAEINLKETINTLASTKEGK
jgi:sulfhydrogenase subunit beta (sulfur reductase)